MAENDLSESNMTNMDPVMELIFTKVIPCPGVGILKMMHCSAARPGTGKYMSTSPGLAIQMVHIIFERLVMTRKLPDMHGYA